MKYNNCLGVYKMAGNMKRIKWWVMAAALVCSTCFMTSCSDDDDANNVAMEDEAQLPNIDYAKAFSDYLLSHGMSRKQLDALIQALYGA